MSLRSKIVLILAAVIGGYAFVDSIFQRRTFGELFSKLEQESARRDVERISEAIWEEAQDLNGLCIDWAAWDDMYSYVDSPTASFETSNLGPLSLGNAKVDLVFICDETGRVVFNKIIDPDSDEEIQLREFPSQTWTLSHPLLAGHRRLSEPHEFKPYGLWQNEYKPLLLSSAEITTSDQSAAPRGWVVLGRFLARDLDKELTQRTRVDFDFWPLDGRTLDDVDSAVLDEVTASAQPVVTAASEESLHSYVTFPDVQRNSALLLRANVARDITTAGRKSLGYAMTSTVISGLLLLFVLTGLIQRTILSPLSKLTNHALWIGKHEDFTAKLSLERNDEIGILSREFNDMMEKLEQSRAQLVGTARAAGMSEIATGILHNVGNVLNSVNISATVIHQKVSELAVDDLNQLSTIVADHADDLPEFIANDPKGKHLQPYLAALTEHIDGQQRNALEEIESLNSGIDHIRELIKSQQSFAVKAELVESTSLPERLEEAIGITNQALVTDESLEIVRDFDELPRVMTDKHKLLGILVNLIQNARQSIDAAVPSPKQLVLRIRDMGEEWIEVSVADNGLGISSEDLVQVFNLGFTTRKDGHGYGLHTAANAAKELGGKLTASSDGPGHGAEFTLTIPKRIAVTKNG